MKAFLDEVDENHAVFTKDWREGLNATLAELTLSTSSYVESYRRLVSFQAWRSEVLEQELNEEALNFFIEAQNDVLVSHAMAACGSWRTALKGLRSGIENILSCLYYKDHPVELELWLLGKHRLGFSEVLRYFQNHPKLKGLRIAVTGLDNLEKEYATLSKAVHASAKPFRMTKNGCVNLWSADKQQLSQWLTRQRKVVENINVLLLALYHHQLEGAAFPGLRKAISLAISPKKCTDIRASMKVNIPSST